MRSRSATPHRTMRSARIDRRVVWSGVARRRRRSSRARRSSLEPFHGCSVEAALGSCFPCVTVHDGPVGVPVGAQQRDNAYRPPVDAQTLLAMEVLGSLNDVERRHAPPVLHLAGDRGLLAPGIGRVSIVGSRSASEDGLRRAAKLARELARAGIVVVSGLAKGIDAAAHTASISAGGRTIAVLGTPLDRVYPAEHAELQEMLYREHLVVSQFERGHTTHKSDFVNRNRTMALLSHASVIVEAGETSGTLSQASETQRLGRPLFMMRSVLAMPGLSWPERFARSGALALDDTSQIVAAVHERLLGPSPA